MFREITRIKQKIQKERCIDILRTEKRGVLAVQGDDGYPYAMPINHYYNDDDGRIYFHSGMTGHKIDALKKCDKVSFCVYECEKTDSEWYLTVNSVIVFGRVEFETDRQKVYDISRLLSRKFTDDSEYIENEIAKFGKNTLMFAIIPKHITGKTVKEK